MGYMFVLGQCYGCKRMFSFNADWVPSVPINGVREPICRDCVERANPQRIANGLDPIVPHPEAYEPQEVA
jgi:hypothetical protein